MSPGEISRVAEVAGKLGIGELKEISLDQNTFLDSVADAIGSFWEEKGMESRLAIELFDSITVRLKDQ